MVLGNPPQFPGFQRLQGLPQSFRSQQTQPFRQFTAGLAFADFRLRPQQHVPGVDPLVHHHRGDAGNPVPRHDCMGDRCAAPVLRQKRCVDVDVSQRRNIQDLFAQDLPECRRDAQIRLQSPQVFHAGFPDPFRLENRDAGLQRRLLYGAGRQFVAASPGPVRLGKDANDFRAGEFQQRLQAGYGKIRGSHKHNSHCRSSSGICPSISSSVSSRSITSMYSVPSR